MLCEPAQPLLALGTVVGPIVATPDASIEVVADLVLYQPWAAKLAEHGECCAAQVMGREVFVEAQLLPNTPERRSHLLR